MESEPADQYLIREIDVFDELFTDNFSTGNKQSQPYEATEKCRQTPHGTSFLDLPRELRDEIYQYAIPKDKATKICVVPRRHRWQGFRLSEPLPTLFYAIPLLRSEILSFHYRTNRFRFSAYHTQKWLPNASRYYAASQYGDCRAIFLFWIRQRGEVLAQNLRHLRISHYTTELSVWGLEHYPRPIPLFTDLSLRPRGEHDVTHQCKSPASQYWHAPTRVQTLKPLLSRDGLELSDLEVTELPETPMSLGPVIALALQILRCIDMSAGPDSMEAAAIAFFQKREYKLSNFRYLVCERCHCASVEMCS